MSRSVQRILWSVALFPAFLFILIVGTRLNILREVQRGSLSKLFLDSFESEETVEVVPQTWCPSDSKCYWPPTSLQNQIKNLVTKCSPCDPQTWILYSGKILHKTMLYKRARELLSKAELTSDLASEVETLGRGQRCARSTKKRDIRMESDDSFDSDEDETRKTKIPSSKSLSLNYGKLLKKKKIDRNIRLPTPPPLPGQETNTRTIEDPHGMEENRMDRFLMVILNLMEYVGHIGMKVDVILHLEMEDGILIHSLQLPQVPATILMILAHHNFEKRFY